MAHNTVPIVKDVDGKPVPQLYNDVDNQYEVLQGRHGASRTILYDENGNHIDLTALISSIVNILNEKNLPTNASTESKQNEIIDELYMLESMLLDLDVSIAESLPSGTNNIGKVDVENSNLPVGASTEAKQDEIIVELQKPIKLDGSTMEYYGNSTDEKPTENIIVGSTYFEIDTVEVYMWDGTSWVVI